MGARRSQAEPLSSRPGRGTALPRWLPILAGAAIGVAGALVAALLVHPLAHPVRQPPVPPQPAQAAIADVTWPAGARPAPVFTLTDQNGSPLSLSSERGRVVLLTFMDSVCRKLCPIEGGELTEAQRQ